jgi:hypothetical protein
MPARLACANGATACGSVSCAGSVGRQQARCIRSFRWTPERRQPSDVRVVQLPVAVRRRRGPSGSTSDCGGITIPARGGCRHRDARRAVGERVVTVIDRSLGRSRPRWRFASSAPGSWPATSDRVMCCRSRRCRATRSARFSSASCANASRQPLKPLTRLSPARSVQLPRRCEPVPLHSRTQQRDCTDHNVGGRVAVLHEWHGPPSCVNSLVGHAVRPGIRPMRVRSARIVWRRPVVRGVRRSCTSLRFPGTSRGWRGRTRWDTACQTGPARFRF